MKHILSGKAIARAIRGHFMVHAALNTMLAANAYNIKVPIKEECRDEVILHRNEVLLDPVNYVLDGGSLLHRLPWT